jgi:hypothetical protein
VGLKKFILSSFVKSEQNKVNNTLISTNNNKPQNNRISKEKEEKEMINNLLILSSSFSSSSFRPDFPLTTAYVVVLLFVCLFD